MIAFVATPIGNLKDITLRALEELRAADVIFCEDTRHTLRLLNAYEIKKPLFSCHKFNEREAAERILAFSREGKRVCVVSDAGMPVISDPGSTVCATLRAAGEDYTVIPGANAALCALILSALPADRFTFVGFLPDKTSERRAALERYAASRETLIFHCAPQDVDDYVSLMYAVFGERRACAVREITKLHEESVSFLLSEGLAGEKRGEYVLVVEGAKEQENPLNALSVREHVLAYMREGYDKKEALKRAAKDRGVPKSALYKETLDL
ncbi:MAG TPA: 16S rRNA (cytidine(1402)-2'-O)-methyltransferase [Candidatus Gallimonas intestinigallinarum]|uniref:Ribosomal RNA small subunit methyltransferase I n=1 Tax=Candidatus Gallimonas intestinigallinarum TaxID=2838604 RepID=A0A9D2DXB9_9FIRM|nr:16S rRNA (cytidine(1402)-2'-O)-methyltransferase [Candidatus Gallimonas intestinigallinarum]